MTNRRTSKENRRRPAAKSRKGLVVPVALVAILAAAALIALATSGPADDAGARFLATGEISEMGMPVLETPGVASGLASAGGVEVTGATWEMGRVPLEVAVRPSWTLVNTSGEAVSLGEPHPEIRAGCCPGAFTIGDARLAPGESTTLTFELSMHPGMDGWHDFAVHVPVLSSAGAQELLELVVTGDFRGAFEG
jgi:hypothetical protein